MNLSSYIDIATSVEPVPIRAIRASSRPVRSELGDVSELINSIQTNGLLQPVLVRPTGDSKFEVILGNRRLEACRSLHWFHIPAIIREASPREAFELSLAENIHHRSLGILDEARAFKRYVDQEGWGSVGQLARKIGKSVSYVSHRILLLSLPPHILTEVQSGQISATLAKQLIWLDDPTIQEKIAEQSIRLKLSTRAATQLVKYTREDHGSGMDSSDPDFFILQSSPPNYEGDRSLRALKQTIMTMKLALARLDIVKERCSARAGRPIVRGVPATSNGKTPHEAEEQGSSSEVESFIQDLRFEIHQMLDRCIRKKMELERKEIQSARSADHSSRLIH